MNPSHIQMTGKRDLKRGWGVIVRLSVAVAVSCLVLTGLSAADPVAAAIKKQTNISPQGLGSALQALAQDRELQVLYRTEVVGDRETSGAVGELTFDEALSKLLSGTGLTFQYLDEKTVTILPAAEAAKRQPLTPVRAATRDKAQARADNANETPARASFWDRIRLAQAATDTAISGSAATDNSSGPEPQALEEVLVTAQKRAERVQNVPISISVVSGDELDQSTVQGVTEALNSVPGVTALPSINGGSTLLSVRGVTSYAAQGSGSSPVGYYLDYVPFAFVRHAAAPDPNAYDLERVEVLRGPQGTLYGASAQNGVMRVLTRSADLSKFAVKARASASSTQSGGTNSRIDSALNVPIVPGVLAARLVVGYQDMSGWIDKPLEQDANDGEIRNARLRVDAQPTDQLSLSLSSWISRSDFGAGSLSGDGETNPSLVPDPIEVDFDTFGLRVGYEFDGISLSSTSGYLDYSNDSYADFALLGLPNTRLQTLMGSRSFSQEVLLQSNHEGAWRWSLGGMYRDAKDRLFQIRRQYAQPTDYRDTSKSMAAFGELSRLLAGGKVELTGGFRYFEDEVTSEEKSRGTIVVVTPNQLIRSEARFTKLSPRAVVTLHPSDELTADVSYSEGFRSGFPQNGNVVAVAPQFAPVKADNLKNYELGSKASFWDRRLRVEGAVFFLDWQDIQENLGVNIGTPANPVNVTAVVNGESASGLGAELTMSIEPTEGLLLGLSFSWNDLTFDAPVMSNGAVLFAAGDRLNASPEYIAGLSAEYAFPVRGGSSDVRIWASGNYTSEMSNRGIILGQSLEALGDEILLARAGLTFNTAGWSASLFVDNITNEDGTPLVQASLPVFFSTRLRPRTVGLQLEYRL